jgi:hypothetical protein
MLGNFCACQIGHDDNGNASPLDSETKPRAAPTGETTRTRAPARAASELAISAGACGDTPCVKRAVIARANWFKVSNEGRSLCCRAGESDGFVAAAAAFGAAACDADETGSETS